MNKKHGKPFNWAICGLIGCAIALFAVSNQSGSWFSHMNGVDADEISYSLPFTSSHNRFSTSATVTTGTALTANGSAISFTYNKLTQTAGTWETVAPGGYFYNTTPISGLKTISVTFGDSNGISLSYGWQNRSTGVITYRISGVSLSSATSSYSFQDERPDCFKIQNASGTATASIISFTITYSCSANSDPYLSTEGLQFTLVGGASYSVSGYSGSSTVVVIPSRYLGKNVTSIGDFGLSWCASVTSITIPNSITSIGDYAFYGCSLLVSITIPSSVISIGEGPFFVCPKLAYINVDYENEFYTSSSGNLYSKDGTTLLAYCPKLTGTSFTVPDSVTSIGAAAFSYCTSLASIMIPNSVTSIGTYAFYYCSSLTAITIPSSITSIGTFAFDNCTSLPSITIPSSVTSISDGAFSLCSSLTSISIPSSVTSIGDGAFWGCTSLTSVEIPSGVTSIGDETFANCPSFTSFVVASDNEHYSSDESGVLYNKIKTLLVHYPQGQKATSFAIPSSVTTIDVKAFYGCTSLTEITLSSNVTSIGDAAFIYCASLISITISSNVTSIGNYAFEHCTSLASITIPSGVISLKNYVFYDCSSLTSITIPSNVTSIGNGAFGNCTKLTSITIPSSVTAIGDYAFEYCTSLALITIPVGVTSIGYNAFYGCISLTINCKTISQPSGWEANWNPDSRPVNWGV